LASNIVLLKICNGLLLDLKAYIGHVIKQSLFK